MTMQPNVNLSANQKAENRFQRLRTAALGMYDEAETVLKLVDHPDMGVQRDVEKVVEGIGGIILLSAMAADALAIPPETAMQMYLDRMKREQEQKHVE